MCSPEQPIWLQTRLMMKCGRNHSPRFCQSCLPPKLFLPDQLQTQKALLQHYPNSTLSCQNQKTAGSIPFALQSVLEPAWGRKRHRADTPRTRMSQLHLDNYLPNMQSAGTYRSSTQQAGKHLPAVYQLRKAY